MRIARFLSGGKGQALIIAMVLLLVGALVIVPLLGYTWSGLKATKDVHEKRMDEYYAADAGVEYGLWHLQDVKRLKQLVEDYTGDTLPDDWKPADYAWPVDGIPCNPGEEINDKTVTATVGYLPDDKVFRIISTALSEDGSSITIDCYAGGLDFTDLLQNAITSRSKVILQPKVKVYGEEDGGDVIWCEGDEPPQNQVIGSEVIKDCEVGWPSPEMLAGFYWDDIDVPETTVFTQDTLNLKNWPELGPFYRNGKLDIKNTGGATITTLQNTIYVNGNLTFEALGVPNPYTIELNGQTIFVDGEIDFPPQPPDKDIVILEGPGCIIAVGDIKFRPAIKGESFIFVMSVTGTTQFQPRGNFYGSIAGNVEVNLHPGSTLTWLDPPLGLNFPGSNPAKFILDIKSWEIETSKP